MDVTATDGLQFVAWQLATPSLETANQVILSFMGLLQPLLTDVNAHSAQIAAFRLELKDGQGNLILTYILDMQILAGSGWMAADGLAFLQGPPPAP